MGTDTKNIFDLSGLTRKIASMRIQPETKEKMIRQSDVSRNTDVKEMYTFQSSSRHSDASPQDLSERWFISLSQATKTLKKHYTKPHA